MSEFLQRAGPLSFLPTPLMGYFERSSKAYKVWIPSNHKFTISQDVIVYENITRIIDDDDEPPQSAPREGVLGQGTQSTPLVTSEKSDSVQTETSQDIPLSSDNSEPVVQIPEGPKTPEPWTPEHPKSIPLPPPAPCHTTRTTQTTWKKQEEDESSVSKSSCRTGQKTKPNQTNIGCNRTTVAVFR
jgi:hypothetical protein